jgi:hypothetical protein
MGNKAIWLTTTGKRRKENEQIQKIVDGAYNTRRRLRRAHGGV